MSSPTPTGRRRFLSRAASVVATVLAMPRSMGSGADQALPIIDTHQHLWDLSRFRLPWLEHAPKLNRSFLTSDYLEATRGLNVVKAIYMEVDVDPAQQVQEAEDLIDLCRGKKTPTVAAVISGRPASEQFGDYLARFKGVPEIKGIRQVLHGSETPPGFCTSEAFVRGVRLLGGAGLTFDLCVRAAELRDAAKLVDACPETRFILDHCGNADVLAKDRTAWKRDIAEVAKRDRAVCKVSGIVASTKGTPWVADDLAPIVNHVLEVFGPERVMFGGDWPVCTLGASYRQWVDALQSIVAERPELERRKLFHDNAMRVYRLS